MTDLFASGRVVDVLLGLMLLEAVLLVAWRRHTGAGPGTGALLASLAAGGCLMLALRCALAGSEWPWVALWLVAALVAHVADLAGRWRSTI